MSITLKQFNNSLVTPTDDAVLYEHLLGANGILSGCTVTTTGGNTLNVADGRGFICGRQFVIEAQTVTATLPTSGTVIGRLLIQINMADENTPITFVTQAAATLPELEQDDINAGGTVYQFPLVTYTATATMISDIVNVAEQLPEAVHSFNGRAGDIKPTAGDYSGALVKMTGYSKPTAGSAVAASDTVNEAVGKIEKRIDTLSGTASVIVSPSDFSLSGVVYVATLAVSGVTATNKVIVSPKGTVENIHLYEKSGLFASAQGAGTLTFTAKKKPTESISVNIMYMN